MIFPAISRRHVVRYPGQTADMLSMLSEKRFKADDQIQLLEKRFAEFVGVDHSMAASSGRIALETILQALELPEKGEVILPAYTYHSVPDAIRNVGLVPVFVDVNPQDNNLDPQLVKEKISEKTVAVLATHIFGHPCNIDALEKLCADHGIVLLEDCAHTLGGKFDGRKVGAIGRAGFFSFGATKVFNTFGGGMVTTSDDKLAAKIRKALDAHQPPNKNGLIKAATLFSLLHLLTRRWSFSLTLYPALFLIDVLNLDLIGIYSKIFKKTAEAISVPVRFSNLQATLALKQLELIDKRNKQSRKNAEVLLKELKPGIKRLYPTKNVESVWYFFAIGVEDREQIAKALLRKGIDTGKHIMENCARLSKSEESFPITEWWYEHSVQIPIYPPLDENDMRAIARVINEII